MPPDFDVRREVAGGHGGSDPFGALPGRRCLSPETRQLVRPPVEQGEGVEQLPAKGVVAER